MKRKTVKDFVTMELVRDANNRLRTNARNFPMLQASGVISQAALDRMPTRDDIAKAGRRALEQEPGIGRD